MYEFQHTHLWGPIYMAHYLDQTTEPTCSIGDDVRCLMTMSGPVQKLIHIQFSLDLFML